MSRWSRWVRTRGTGSDTGSFIAFISYRRQEGHPDRNWAIWLQDRLEAYVVPRRLRRERQLPRKLGIVCRDDTGFGADGHLSNAMRRAVEHSRQLIVVCSPRARASEPMRIEIEHFKSLAGRPAPLALLVEGEPREAFPDLLFAGPDDPYGLLAADVRTAATWWRFRARRTALLKLVAPLLGVGPDELVLRDSERFRRRSVLALVTCCILSATALVGADAWRQAQAVAQSDRIWSYLNADPEFSAAEIAALWELATASRRGI